VTSKQLKRDAAGNNDLTDDTTISGSTVTINTDVAGTKEFYYKVFTGDVSHVIT
jgi:hypothetical protein